jgi:hypothetical protein
MTPNQYTFAGSTSGTQASIITGLNVNFSGTTVSGVQSQFTVAGWIRISPPLGSALQVFGADGFSLFIGTDGRLGAFIMQGAISTDVQIVDNDWHYIAVAFQGDPSQSGGSISMYIDGFPKEQQISSTATQNGAQCTLGTGGIEFASWEIWDRALPSQDLLPPPEQPVALMTPEDPKWYPPREGSDEYSGLIVAFDFADGQVTSSNPAVSIVVPEFWTYRPVVGTRYDDQGSSLSTPSQTPVAIGEVDPNNGESVDWSLLAWVSVPSPASMSLLQRLAPDGDSLNIDINRTDSLLPPPPNSFVLSSSENDGVRTVTVPWPPGPSGEWTHVAVVYSQTTMASIYFNGELATTQPLKVPNLHGGITLFAVAAGASSDDCFMQGLSVWARALNVDEIRQFSNSATLASDTPGLQISCDLMNDFTNAVDGLQLLHSPGVELIVQQQKANNVAAVHSPLAQRDSQPTRAENDSSYAALAKKHGIDLRAPLDAASATPDQKKLTDWFENTFLSGLPPATADPIRQEFGRNLRVATDFRSRGVHPGRTEIRTAQNQTAVYFHEAGGPREIYRSDQVLDDNLLPLIANVVLDCLILGATIFGVSIRRSDASRQLLQSRFRPVLGAMFPQSAQTTELLKEAATAPLAICGAVFNALASGGFLWSLVWESISGSWWSITWAVLSFVAGLLTLVLGAGASLAWRVAQALNAIANLVADSTALYQAINPSDPVTAQKSVDVQAALMERAKS